MWALRVPPGCCYGLDGHEPIGWANLDRHRKLVRGDSDLGTDQYHEPAEELSQKTRTFARMITALVEEGGSHRMVRTTHISRKGRCGASHHEGCPKGGVQTFFHGP